MTGVPKGVGAGQHDAGTARRLRVSVDSDTCRAYACFNVYDKLNTLRFFSGSLRISDCIAGAKGLTCVRTRFCGAVPPLL